MHQKKLYSNPTQPFYMCSLTSSTSKPQVKFDFIFTNSVSINERIELKDNLIVDHVKLELDVG
jgi:apoptotic chromatin condensation inducer in the nucleus